VSSRDITTVNLGRFRGRYRLPHQRPQRAVIFIPDAGAIDAADRCSDLGEAHHLQVVGVIVGDWAAVLAMLRDGTVTVVIADRRDDLPADREPRIEIVADQPPPLGRRTARTSRITRRDAAT
jgi:hypothetical protein